MVCLPLPFLKWGVIFIDPYTCDLFLKLLSDVNIDIFKLLKKYGYKNVTWHIVFVPKRKCTIKQSK